MRTILEILCFEGNVIPASYIPPLDLHKTRKRVVATEIMVQLGQNSAHHAVKKIIKKNKDHRTLLIPEDIFYNSSFSDEGSGVDSTLPGVKLLNNSVLLVNTDRVNVATISHAKIANNMDRCRSTITRRLAKSDIDHKTIYTTNAELKHMAGNYFKLHKVPYFVNDLGEVICNINGTAYKKYCNIYKSTHQIVIKCVADKTDNIINKISVGSGNVKKHVAAFFKTVEELGLFLQELDNKPKSRKLKFGNWSYDTLNCLYKQSISNLTFVPFVI